MKNVKDESLKEMQKLYREAHGFDKGEYHDQVDNEWIVIDVMTHVHCPGQPTLYLFLDFLSQ
jgi:hypothetical protein